MSKYYAFLAVTALSLTFSTPALANPAEIAVSYKDLNLTSAEDRTRLDRRLDSAARAVCHVGSTFDDLSSKAVASRCHDVALDDARQKAQIVVAQARSSLEVAAAK